MTNEQKLKTVEERVKAFRNHCNPIVGNCGTRCRMSEPDKSGGYDMMKCFAYWLTLEAEEETPMPCPFCGSPVFYRERFGRTWYQCDNADCGYTSGEKSTEAATIAAHNRVCRAVKAAQESEVEK